MITQYFKLESQSKIDFFSYDYNANSVRKI